VTRLRPPITSEDHVIGPAKAAVTLVEYGDFQCPYCGAAFWVLRQLEARFHGELLFAFRHFPMSEIHPYAMIAAQAAEAAGAQGKFWEMHDLLFENQEDLSPDQLVAHAVSLDLDTQRFTADLSSHRHAARIRKDFMSGVRSGVNGTPTLFLDGYRFDGPADYTLLSRAIEEARGGEYAAGP
jgi:protein-disulfide isomerase